MARKINKPVLPSARTGKAQLSNRLLSLVSLTGICGISAARNICSAGLQLSGFVLNCPVSSSYKLTRRNYADSWGFVPKP